MSTRTPLFIPELIPRSRFADAAIGAVAGGALGLGLVAVGIGRALVAAVGITLRGDSVPPPSMNDARVVLVYVGAFVVGGAVLGLAAPLLRWHVAKVFAGALVGALGMATVVTVMEGGWSAIERADVVIALIVGGAFGALGGLVMGTAGRSEQEFLALDRQVDEIDSRVAAARRARERARHRRASRSPDRSPIDTDASPSNER